MEEYKRDYEEHEMLGKGAYASVFRVTHKASGVDYACKVMSKQTLGPTGISQVKGEAGILSMMDSPNVVKLHRVIEDNDHLLLVMQLVTGGELLKRLTQLRHYSERTACKLMMNFIKGLKYIHGHGIVHRDLKPENLLLANPGEDKEKNDTCVLLADFGFAEKNEGTPLTKACGTPYYIAPELLQTGVYHTRKGYVPPPCDMWSAGVVCFVLLCGYPPFRVPRDTKDAKSKLFKQIVQGRVTFDRGTSWDRISTEAKDFVRRLLVVEPLNRMTAEQAEEHPWFAAHGVDMDENLAHSIDELKTFEARTKVKAAVYGVEAVFRMMYTESCEHNNVKPNSGVIDQLESAIAPLVVMNLSNTYLGPRGFAVLVNVLNKHKTVKQLVLNNCLLTSEGVARLCKVLRDPHARCSITTLNLSDNPLTSAAGRAILYLTQTRRTITSVDLTKTHISQALLKKIADQLARNKGQTQSLPSRSPPGSRGASPPRVATARLPDIPQQRNGPAGRLP